MAGKLEREIKLRFETAAGARTAVVAAGAAPKEARRLQRDALLDAPDGALRANGAALRVRVENEHAVLTFKGPVQASAMKLREEIESRVADAGALFLVFERLGYHVWFRYEKFREEFVLHGAIVAIDETPVGTFVEIEGEEDAISRVARALGRTPADYVLDSYRGLQVQACERRGAPPSDMLFPPSVSQ